mgnify:CR=1 FL=1
MFAKAEGFWASLELGLFVIVNMEVILLNTLLGKYMQSGDSFSHIYVD